MTLRIIPAYSRTTSSQNSTDSDDKALSYVVSHKIYIYIYIYMYIGKELGDLEHEHEQLYLRHPNYAKCPCLPGLHSTSISDATTTTRRETYRKLLESKLLWPVRPSSLSCGEVGRAVGDLRLRLS